MQQLLIFISGIVTTTFIWAIVNNEWLIAVLSIAAILSCTYAYMKVI